MTEFTTMNIHDKLMLCGVRKLMILAKNHSLEVADDATKRTLVPMLEKIADDDDFPIKCNYDSIDDRIATMSKAEKKYLILAEGLEFTDDYKKDDASLRSFITIGHFPIVFKKWGDRWREATPAGKLKMISPTRLDKLLGDKGLDLIEGMSRLDKIHLLENEVDEYDF